MPADPRVHVGVAVFVKNVNGRIAMLKRGPNATHGANLWSVPGGWIDYGETPEETALREVREEVGLGVTQPRFIGSPVVNTYEEQNMHVVCNFYVCQFKSGLLQNLEPDKAETVQWVQQKEIHKLDLFPPVDDFLFAHGLKVLA